MSVEFSFDDLIDILDGEEFEERPVDLQTFVTSPDYLGLPPLSDLQYTLIENNGQLVPEFGGAFKSSITLPAGRNIGGNFGIRGGYGGLFNCPIPWWYSGNNSR